MAAMWVGVQESQKRNNFSVREQASRHFERNQTAETIANQSIRALRLYRFDYLDVVTRHVFNPIERLFGIKCELCPNPVNRMVGSSLPGEFGEVCVPRHAVRDENRG